MRHLFLFPRFPVFFVSFRQPIRYKSEFLSRVEEEFEIATDSPIEWYPGARKMKRKLFLHIGPTNSGKTHSTLVRFKNSRSGVYCGPLRLLAYEQYDRLNSSGTPCHLLTGQQEKIVEDAQHMSCTVEMAPFNTVYECAVLDEIQMIGDPYRGWAWTRALLGLQAKEIHMCGNESVLPLIQKLAQLLDEELEITVYKRLSRLSVAERCCNSLDELQKGDCLVTFSKKHIYALKYLIEKERNMKCCVVYGSLPPETRSQQAALFNDVQNDFDVLIASDAVGMGLNLNIKRIIFSAVEKFDGHSVRPLEIAELQQIAGRAGRFGGRYPEGLVSSFDKEDHRFIKETMKLTQPDIQAACLLPLFEHFEAFANEQPGYLRRDKLLKNFYKHLSFDDLFFMGNYEIALDIAKNIEDINLPLRQFYTILQSPVNKNDLEYLRELLLELNEEGSARLNLKLPLFPKKWTVQVAKQYIETLEDIHAKADLYLWLANRYPEFEDIEDARRLQANCQQLLEQGIASFGYKTKNLSFLKNLRLV